MLFKSCRFHAHTCGQPPPQPQVTVTKKHEVICTHCWRTVMGPNAELIINVDFMCNEGGGHWIQEGEVIHHCAGHRVSDDVEEWLRNLTETNQHARESATHDTT